MTLDTKINRGHAKMKKNAKIIKDAFVTVFRNPKYLLMSAILSFLFFFVFIIANNIPFFMSSVSDWGPNPLLLLSFVQYLAKMIITNSGIAMFVSIIAVSTLSAINISMIVYKLKTVRKLSPAQTKKEKGFPFALAGTFGGALSSGCPACSATLISLMGVSGGLAIFPFKGLELRDHPKIGQPHFTTASNLMAFAV